MDKYEFNIKIEQMRKLVNRGDYETAMKIADTIDWKKVRNANLLSMVATIYEKNGEYQDSKDILLLAFERAPIGKRLLYKLTDLALKEGNIKEAEDYYREFCDLAGDDPRQQLLRYKILKQMDAPLEQQIHSLESYTAEELDEKWLYELAELYQKAGNAERCVATCDKIMLLFGLGKYVDKAMDLKVQYAPLNKYQMDLVENRDKYEEKLRAVEQSFASGDGMASLESDPEEIDEDDLLPDEQDGMVEETAQTEETEVSGQSEQTAEPVEEQAAAEPTAQQIVQETKQETKVESEAADHADKVAEPETVREQAVAQPVEEKPAETEEKKPEIQQPEVRKEEVQKTETQKTEIELPDEIPLPKTDASYEKENIAVAVKQAEVEQSLAREMSRLKDVPVQEDSELGKTRVLREIRRAPSPVQAQTQILPTEADLKAKMAEPDMIVEDLDDEEEQTEPTGRKYLMIEARTPEKGLELAVQTLKEIHRESGRKNPVAKITGSRLNKRGVLASASKLAGKDLIVEEAGDLTPSMLKELDQMIEQDKSGMRILLIDNPKQMEMMNRENPFLAGRFEQITCENKEETSSHTAAHTVSGTSAVRPAETSAAQQQSAQEIRREKVEIQIPPRSTGSRNADGRVTGSDYYEDGRRYAESKKAEASATATAIKLAKDEDSEEERPVRAVVPVTDGAMRAPDPDPDEEYETEYSEEEQMQDDDAEMDIDEFAQYCCKYASEIDCSITGKSMLALYERIEIMEEDGIALTKAAAEDLIEEAADRAEKPSMGHRLKGLFSSKYDKDGLLILREEHFI